MTVTLKAFVLAGATFLDPKHDHTIVATAITNVVEREPPLFKGDDDKRRTASFILAIGYREGRLAPSVVGDCTQSKAGEPCKGTPHSFCFMQVHKSIGGSEELNRDPEKCVRAGMAFLRTSMRACPASNPLGVYAAGPSGCSDARAQRISNDRVWLARRVFAEATKATSPIAIATGGA